MGHVDGFELTAIHEHLEHGCRLTGVQVVQSGNGCHFPKVKEPVKQAFGGYSNETHIELDGSGVFPNCIIIILMPSIPFRVVRCKSTCVSHSLTTPHFGYSLPVISASYRLFIHKIERFVSCTPDGLCHWGSLDHMGASQQDGQEHQ